VKRDAETMTTIEISRRMKYYHKAGMVYQGKRIWVSCSEITLNLANQGQKVLSLGSMLAW
jgi:hypothetical protein